MSDNRLYVNPLYPRENKRDSTGLGASGTEVPPCGRYGPAEAHDSGLGGSA
jgi:hypothetical protein